MSVSVTTGVISSERNAGYKKRRRKAVLPSPICDHYRLGWYFFLILPAQAQTTKPPLYFNHSNDGFSANGRWVPADAKQKAAFPTEVELDCDRITKSCVEATAEYYSGHPHVSIDYLQIDKWDTNGITASSSSGICMVRNVAISFGDKTIVQTVSSKTLDQEKLKACKLLGA